MMTAEEIVMGGYAAFGSGDMEALGKYTIQNVKLLSMQTMHWEESILDLTIWLIICLLG